MYIFIDEVFKYYIFSFDQGALDKWKKKNPVSVRKFCELLKETSKNKTLLRIFVFPKLDLAPEITIPTYLFHFSST